MAQITIDIPDEQVPRVVAALRAAFPGFDQMNDGPFVKKMISSWLKSIVQSYEYRQQVQQLPPIEAPDVT